MIDFSKIEQYRENNRIEAKKALGGLPQSIWETYSAFANTLGGIILLGVEEHSDHSLHTIDLPDPERLVREFWDKLNAPNKVSVNILTHRDVQIENIDGHHIIVITVPRAQRYDKPVYIDGNPLSGSYRRSGEGDYKCTREEVQSMFRDAAVQSQDMKVLAHMDTDVLDEESIRRYRLRMQACHPGHAWEELSNLEFLYKLGAVGKGADGALHPTAAGLLMFGFEYEIVKEFPRYFLDYQEQPDSSSPWTDRIISSSGDWSGNLYDFFFLVCEKMTRDIKVSLHPESSGVGEGDPVPRALREALANCVINADYHGRQGLVIIKSKHQITFSNPGAFRIELKAARNGGISDPRNTALIKMFNMVNVGKRAGGGIAHIYSTWNAQGWAPPAIEERFDPERTIVTLPIGKVVDPEPRAHQAEKRGSAKTAAYEAAIIEYLTDNVSGAVSDFSNLLGLKSPRVKALLSELMASEIVVAEGDGQTRVYKLKH